MAPCSVYGQLLFRESRVGSQLESEFRYIFPSFVINSFQIKFVPRINLVSRDDQAAINARLAMKLLKNSKNYYFEIVHFQNDRNFSAEFNMHSRTSYTAGSRL